MSWFALGIVLGIVAYWIVALIMAQRVMNRYLDSSVYLPMWWFGEPPGKKPHQ
jgi:hypothetical protein